MAVTVTGVVGIVSNPDARVDPTFTDANPRNITVNATGRKPKTYVRSNDPDKPAGGS